jgi:predicted protein tyrosine phosphatase
MFRGIPGFYVRSRGTEPDARVRITAGDIGWADRIFVMEKRHRDRMQKKFRQELEGKEVVCLHIKDEYEYMEPALVDLLKRRLAQYVSVSSWDGA